MKKVLFLTSTSVYLFLLLIVISISAFFVSCKKDKNEKTENLCPVVAASAVPQVVKDSFAVRYPTTIVITWFNKDSVNYCAYFKTATNVETLAEFANNGSFIKEQIETHNDNEQEDSTTAGVKTTTSCECETQKEVH